MSVVVLLTIFVFGGHRGKWEWVGSYDKTLWDYVSLMAMPLIVVIAAALFSYFQADRQQDIEEQRAQDAALQSYLDQMSRLMLENNLRDAAEGNETRTLAGARTLTILQSLGEQKHKKSVLRFLYEANLIDSPQPIVGLEGANLQDIDLENTNLSGGPFLVSPSMRRCEAVMLGGPGSLFGGDHADLSGANLAGANLREAFLAGVDLKGANLSGADLREVSMLPDFSNAEESGWRVRAEYECDVADFPLFQGSDDFPFLPEGAVRTNLEGADLSHANMQEANVSGVDLRGSALIDADLRDANLKAADLEGADLQGANLSLANLKNASITEQQRTEASSIQGATLPDGTIKAMSLQGAAGPDGSILHRPYATEEFDPAMLFRVSDGSWQVPYPDYPETTDAVSLEIVGEGQLAFARPTHVFDPSNLSELKVTPAPENTDEWVSWFEGHPNLETSTPVPATVGGAPGMQIDVTYVRALFNYPRDLCDEYPCVPLFPIIDGVVATYFDTNNVETKSRFIIVDTGSETVVVNVNGLADNFDEFLPKAQKVLESVEWKQP